MNKNMTILTKFDKIIILYNQTWAVKDSDLIQFLLAWELLVQGRKWRLTFLEGKRFGVKQLLWVYFH